MISEQFFSIFFFSSQAERVKHIFFFLKPINKGRNHAEKSSLKTRDVRWIKSCFQQSSFGELTFGSLTIFAGRTPNWWIGLRTALKKARAQFDPIQALLSSIQGNYSQDPMFSEFPFKSNQSRMLWALWKTTGQGEGNLPTQDKDQVGPFRIKLIWVHWVFHTRIMDPATFPLQVSPATD